ncbi:MAG: nitronate monooxygenase [Candidatus Paceibacterota bacterium]
MKIIQGGMGVGVSGWQLAKAVCLAGCVGTLSGTAAPELLVNALIKGDIGGHFRRALKSFPFPNISEEVLAEYFVEEGIQTGKKHAVPMFGLNSSRGLIALTICANFALVYLAKEGHNQTVFINYLEKIQIPHIYSIVGAMLAGVDGIVMGAGIPHQVPKIIDAILAGAKLEYILDVTGGSAENPVKIEFDPVAFLGGSLSCTRPKFYPIVSSYVLAARLAKNCDGFIVESPTAGGHNAPPRKGKDAVYSPEGIPLYGPKDNVDWEKMRGLGKPFWIAGSMASPEALQFALAQGAEGIQAGTIFAFCVESGIAKIFKREVCRRVFFGEPLVVRTDFDASPTGFPFKVVCLSGTLSEESVYESRCRVCDKGYLRELYVRDDGKIGFRCPAEPVSEYLRKGGKLEDTEKKVCLCNGLLATVGLGSDKLAILTSGDDLSSLSKLLKHEGDLYTAEDAIKYLLS